MIMVIMEAIIIISLLLLLLLKLKQQPVEENIQLNERGFKINSTFSNE